jgi:thiamine biosynthesis protein ThiS
MLNIIINGEEKKINPNISVTNLISKLELDIEKIAVELNQEILHLENHSKTILKEGDELEIIHFVGGG